MINKETNMMPEDYFKKNIELWEQFTTSYMDTMFRMVGKTMDQSQAFQDQMERVVDETVSKQMTATMTALQAMQGQMESLSQKMDQMLEKMEI
jgi:ribonuclease I